MENKIKISLEEFNQKYDISVMVTAFQAAKLTANVDELAYQAITDISDNVQYAVYTHDGDEVLTSEATTDIGFIEDLLERFEIPELEALL